MSTDQNQPPGQSEPNPPQPEQPYPVHSQLPQNPNPPQPQQPTQPPQQPPQPQTNWQQEYLSVKNRYDGLSGHAKKEKNRADNLQGQLQNTSSEFERYKLETDAQLKTLTEDLTAHKTLAEQLQRENTTIKRTNEVGQLVRTEFPGLAGLFEKGYIRGIDGLEGEDLKTFLTDYQSELGLAGQEQKRQEHSGSTPPPPGQKNSGAMTLADAQNKLQAAQSKYVPGSPEATQAMNEYLEALKSLEG